MIWVFAVVSSLSPRPARSSDVLRRKAPDLYSPADASPQTAVQLKKPEVMAPAGGWPQLRAAALNGADAVYLGLSSFSARARAANFDASELDDVVSFCRSHEVKVYVAINTLVFDEELDEVARLLGKCKNAGVDAVIVQDLGVLRLAVELGLEAHASTQQSISSELGAEFAFERGASRVVVGRELSVDEIAAVVRGTRAEVEVFVHGAMCVSWSGQCFSSEAWGGRSANRGQCAQACRLPYGVVVDGQQQETSYALSPQDLCGVDHVPALIEAGVACLKIEGRLKDERYVAATTRAYRQAVDAYFDDVGVKDVSRSELAQVFSRGQDAHNDGLSPGFLDGPHHSTYVVGKSPRHRGVFVGRVERVVSESPLVVDVVQDQGAPLKRGDGIVFQEHAAAFQATEVGGSLYDVRPGPVTRCTFGRGFETAPRPGAEIWKTSDAAVDAKLSRLATKPSRLDRVKRTAVACRVQFDDGIIELVDDDGLTATAKFATLDSPTPRDAVEKAVGCLGDTPWRLQSLQVQEHATKGARSSDLKDARRRAVDTLFKLRSNKRRNASEAGSWTPSPRRSLKQTSDVGVALLVRSLEQCRAAVQCSRRHSDKSFDVDEIVLDFLEITGLREAVGLVRDANLTAVVATPRILTPTDARVWTALLDLDAPLLVRSAGLLHALRKTNTSFRGDFSLNAANSATANHLLDCGLERLTPTYDLSADAISRLASRTPPSSLEIVAHLHLPIFHSSHCVYARHLSSGDDYRDCGHPCERHTIHLRDDHGNDHLVLADMGCRNTVFNAAAQSGAKSLGSWLAAGITRFRLEFVDESPASLEAIVDAYATLFADTSQPEPLWSLLRQVPDANGNSQGVHVGSFRNTKERLAGQPRTLGTPARRISTERAVKHANDRRRRRPRPSTTRRRSSNGRRHKIR